MGQELLIREVFRLSGGITVFACEGTAPLDALTGRQVQLVVDGQVRQSIVLTNERSLLNQTAHLNQHALETHDTVDIFPEEVQRGHCRFVFE